MTSQARGSGLANIKGKQVKSLYELVTVIEKGEAEPEADTRFRWSLNERLGRPLRSSLLSQETCRIFGMRGKTPDHEPLVLYRIR